MLTYKCALCVQETTSIDVVSATWENIDMVGWVCDKHNHNEVEKIRDILIPKIMIRKLLDSF